MNRKALRAFALLLTALLVPACDETTVINQTLPPAPGSTGSGGYGSFGAGVQPGVVFSSDRNQIDVVELWSADLAGTVLVNLSGPLAPGGDVGIFRWSPDRSKVVFIADKDLDGIFEMFVVPAAGGVPVKVVSSPYGFNLDLDLIWSPDSTRILYSISEPSGNFGLRTVRADGTGGVDLTAPLGFVGISQLPGWSPDSSRVAFLSGPGFSTFDLYCGRADGAGGLTKVSGTLPPGGSVGRYAWAPDGSRIAYSADQDADDEVELFTTLPATAASIVQVSGAMTTGGDVDPNLFQWAPDSSRLFYLADEQTDGLIELHTAPGAASGASVKVSAPIAAGDQVTFASWAPDGSRIAYLLLPVGGVGELHTTLPTSAASAVKISATPPPGGNGAGLFSWSPNSSRLAYVSDEISADVAQVFTAPADTAGASIAASKPSLDGTPFDPEPKWSPDSSQVAYLLDEDTVGIEELYTAPGAATAASFKVSGTPPPGLRPRSFEWTTDGSRVVYDVYDSLFARGLYAASPISGGPVLVGGPLLNGRRIFAYQVR